MGELRGAAAVAGKEVRELLRDPVTLGVAFLLPVVLLFIFGYALRLDVREAPTAVLDLDATPESRRFADVMDRTEEFNVVSQLTASRQVEDVLARGTARLVLVIPAGFGRDLARGEPTAVQMLVDGSFSATARVVAATTDAVAASFSPRSQPGGRRPGGPSAVETRVWYNPELRSTLSVVPGLFAVILMAFPPLLTALAVVREKERGTIRQILLSPLPAWAFVLGKLAPYAVVALLDLALVLGAGMVLFDIPFRGSLPLLAAASALYVLATLGIGLFVSTVTRTQVVALLLVLVLTVMPSFMFSGFLYPIFTMPEALQAYTHLFPGRYFVEISRGSFLKGVGIEVLWPELALIGLYAGLMVALASWRLRERTA